MPAIIRRCRIVRIHAYFFLIIIVMSLIVLYNSITNTSKITIKKLLSLYSHNPATAQNANIIRIYSWNSWGKYFVILVFFVVNFLCVLASWRETGFSCKRSTVWNMKLLFLGLRIINLTARLHSLCKKHQKECVYISEFSDDGM